MRYVEVGVRLNASECDTVGGVRCLLLVDNKKIASPGVQRKKWLVFGRSGPHTGVLLLRVFRARGDKMADGGIGLFLLKKSEAIYVQQWWVRKTINTGDIPYGNN